MEVRGDSWFAEKRCAHCGKIFCVRSSEWAYKIDGKRRNWFCTWSCLCAYRRKHVGSTGRKRERRTPAELIERNRDICKKRNEGVSIEALAAEHGLTESQVYKIVRGLK